MLEMIKVWEFKAVPITVIIGTALKIVYKEAGVFARYIYKYFELSYKM